MDCDVSPSLQTSVSAQSGPHSLSSTLSTAQFDPDVDLAPSSDDPTLEICKRELDAVLASLGP